MRLGIMQPYLFPYAGYFQLIEAVDKFVIYDDVAFIKQGWINRNYIYLNRRKHLFSVPLDNASSYRLIKETLVSARPSKWKEKLLATIRQAYARAPYFQNVFPLIETTLADCAGRPISSVAVDGLQSVLTYLSLSKKIVVTSSVYQNNAYTGADRVIDICQKEGADVYINPLGGAALYEKEHFSRNRIKLSFLTACLPVYRQFGEEFIAGLSIIDVLMFNSPATVREFVQTYELS